MTEKICLLIILAGVLVLLSTSIMAQKCPEPGEGIGTCVEACSNDGNCSNGQLCCSNGCGHQCMSPADPCPTCAAPRCHASSPGTITPEGECCPVCACTATDGSIVAAGTGFMNDCNRCICGSTGVALCTLIACPPTTPLTPSTDPVTLPTSPPSAMCPNTTGLVGTCVERCSGDDECSDGQLCCSNGCGRECLDPVLDCSAVLCFQPNCTSPLVLGTPKGSCCPICGCQTSGGIIAPGGTYQPDSCNTCSCLENGLAICTLAFCLPPTKSTPTTEETTATPTISPTMPECSVSRVNGRARHSRRTGNSTLRFSSDGDPLVSYECKLDDEDFEDCESPVVWTDLKRGRHIVMVKAVCSDDEGKESTSASRRFRFRVR